MDIFNLHPARLITGTESNDSIYNFLDGEMVTINAPGGDDSISNNAGRNSIDGGGWYIFYRGVKPVWEKVKRGRGDVYQTKLDF